MGHLTPITVNQKEYLLSIDTGGGIVFYRKGLEFDPVTLRDEETLTTATLNELANSVAVFRAIYVSILQYVKQHKPSYFQISGNTDKKVKLYQKLIAKHCPAEYTVAFEGCTFHFNRAKEKS